MLTTLLAGLLLTPAVQPPTGDILAIRVGRAETITHGTIEHAVILIEDGKITMVGQDLPIERGVPVLDRPDWVAMPGLVNCYSRVGLDGRAGTSKTPHFLASREIYVDQPIWKDVLETGTTTLGLYPPGSGIPGQAVAVRPYGESIEEMVIADSVYLKVFLSANKSSKKVLRDAFESIDEYDEKVAKAREKFDKAQEKKKKSKSKSKSKKDDAGDGDFVAPEPDPDVKPLLALRDGELNALIRISKAADYVHYLDVLGEREIGWNLRCSLGSEADLYEVADKLGEAEVRVVLDPDITLQVFTRRERNIAAELHRAGAKVALIPPFDSAGGHEVWLRHVGHLVKSGLDRQAALAAVTLEPAAVLGLDERLGSLDEGKDANLTLWSGDPFEPSSRLQMVLLDGNVVFEEEGE